ncbi:MAG TPA: hypothetical protein VEJ87_11030 [Acidimicrobiales bacterium]|nr:hypothetical protein [Acidimicrobiales bacterium]
MHPIERLRAVARASWAPPDVLGSEAAWALADLALDEPAALVPACRRLLAVHPGCGPLWWVAARVLSASDPVEEAERCAGAIDGDPTPDLVEEATSGKRAVKRGGVGEVASADIVVVRVDAMGPEGMLVDGDLDGLLEAAHVVEVPVWVEAGVGRVLPPKVWDALVRRLDTADLRLQQQEHSPPRTLAGVEKVVGPKGAATIQATFDELDCPEPAALLGTW